MNSRKCPKCGLVSFTTAASCKGCQSSLKVSGEVAKAATTVEAYEVDHDEPRRGFSPLRVLLLILLIAIPGWLYYRAQEQAVADQIEQRKKDEQQQAIKGRIDAIKRCRPIMDCPDY
jgi:hypothetical protein